MQRVLHAIYCSFSVWYFFMNLRGLVCDENRGGKIELVFFTNKRVRGYLVESLSVQSLVNVHVFNNCCIYG